MNVDFEKSNLTINQIIEQKREKTTIEGDCIVPDIKPDIMEIIGTSGIVSIYKKEVSDGKVRIDGAVTVYVMYAGSDGENKSVRSINHIIDFSQIIPMKEARTGMDAITEIQLENIDCKIVNERKISIKAYLNFEISLLSNTNVEYVENIKVNNLQKIDKNEVINTVLGIGQTKTNVNEKINIEQTDNLAEILKVDVNIVNKDTKVSYNKVLIKADIIMKILYSTEDGRFNTVKTSFPIVGFIDMKDVTEDNIISSNIEIKNITIKPDGSQDHSISVEMDIDIGIIVYSQKEIKVIKDMYSPNTNLVFNQKELHALSNIKICKSTLNFNQKETVEIGDEKIYDVNSMININETKILNNSIEIKGTTRLTIVHSTNKLTSITTKTLDIPFEHKVMCDGIKDKSNIKIESDISNENYNIIPGGELDIRMDINFTVTSMCDNPIKLIESVEDDENVNAIPYNVIVYYTHEGDTMWKIAKQFRSTREKIMKDNLLENDNVKPGMQLYISRYTG